MYNNRLENNFISGQDVEVIKRSRSERQNYEELANEFRQKLKSTISTSELEKLSKGTNASLKTIQSAILVQGTYLKNIAGSIKNIEAMQKKILQATMPSIKAPTMKKVTDKDRLDIISKSKGFTDFNKSVSDFGSSLTKLIEAQKSNNNEVLAALGMVPKNTSDMISKAFGKFILDNPRMVWLFNLLDKTVGTGARWMIDLGKELSQFNGGFFHKVFGLLSLRQRGAWTTEIQYNPAMPLQSIMSTLNAIHKNVWLINHETMPGMKKAPQELHMEKGTLKAILDQMPPHYKRIAGVLAAIGGVYFPSQMAKFGLWLPKVLGKSVLSILTNRTIMNAALTFAKSPIMTAFALTSFSSLWENIIGSRRDTARERERTRRRAQTDRSNRDRRFVADRNSNDNDVYYYTHDRSEGYWSYVGEEIARAFPKFMEKGFSETLGNIWGALTNQSAIRAKRDEARRKQQEEDNIEIQHEILNMINVNRAHVEDFVMHGADSLRAIQVALTGGANAARNAITSSVQENLRHIRNSLVDRNRAPILRQILRRLTTISSNVNAIITGTRTGRNGNQTRITLGNTGELLYGANNGISRAAAFVGSGATTSFGDVISDKFDTTNYLLTFILKEIRRASGGSGGRRNRNRNNNTSGLAGQVDPSFHADPVVATYLNSLLARADHYNDAIIGPDGNKIADPFGTNNNSTSTASREHPPVLVQDDGKGGVDLSILDRGDNIIAVRDGSPMSQAIHALRNMSHDQIKQVINSVGGFTSNVLNIKGHPILGRMADAATMTASGLVSAHQFVSSDYGNINAHTDAFGNEYQTQSILTMDVDTLIGNVAKGIYKGGEKVVGGILGGITNSYSFIKSSFGGGTFWKDMGTSLKNITKYLKLKKTWDILTQSISFGSILNKSFSTFIAKPYKFISTAFSKSIDFVSSKITAIGQKISGSVIDSFIKDKAKNTAMLGGFGVMSALPMLLNAFGGGIGGNIMSFLNSEGGDIVTGLLEGFGGKFGGFVGALRMGLEFNKTIEDIKKNGFDIGHIGDAAWVGSKAILGSLASIVFGPQAMGIVNSTMDFAKDTLKSLYGEAMDKLTEQWSDTMFKFDRDGLFGLNTMKSTMKSVLQTLALPFGQTAMNVVGDWSDGINDWVEQKIEGTIEWWKGTKEWLSHEFEMIPTRLGGLAYDIAGPLIKGLGDMWNSLLAIPRWFDNKINDFMHKIAKGLEGTWFEKLGKSLADFRSDFTNWGYDKVTFDIDSLRKYKVASDLNTSTSYIDKNMMAKYDANFGKTTSTNWLQDLGHKSGMVYEYDQAANMIRSSKSKAGIGGAIQTLNAQSVLELSKATGVDKNIVNVARRLCQFTGMPFSGPFVHVCEEYIKGHDTSLNASKIKDRKSATEVLAKMNKTFPGMMNQLATTPEEKGRIAFALANMLEGEGADYYKTAQYIDSAVSRGLMNASEAYSIYNYQMDNKGIRTLRDLSNGSRLEQEFGVAFDNDSQRKAILEQIRADRNYFTGKSEEDIRKDIAKRKDEYDIMRSDKAKGNKGLFIDDLKKFITSPEFRRQLGDIVIREGAAGIEKFKANLNNFITELAKKYGYDLTGDDGKELENIVNSILGELNVSMAKALLLENPGTYRNFIQVKWEKLKGYVINLSQEIWDKIKNSAVYEAAGKFFSEKKQEYSSALYKAGDYIKDKVTPYMGNIKTGMATAGAFASNMFTSANDAISGILGSIGFGDAASKLSSYASSITGGGSTASLTSGDADLVSKARAYRNSTQFNTDMKARVGADRYEKWISDDQKYMCAAGLKEVLHNIGVLNQAEKNMKGDAYESDKIFDRAAKSGKLVDVTSVVKDNNINPINLPPGYIVVMDKSAQKKHGHVFMTIGNGMELSDHEQRMRKDYRTSPYGGIKKVYALRSAGVADAGQAANSLVSSGVISSPSGSTTGAAEEYRRSTNTVSAGAFRKVSYSTGVSTLVGSDGSVDTTNGDQKTTAENTTSLVELMAENVKYMKLLVEKGAGNTTIVAPNNSTTVHSTSNTSNNNSGSSNNNADRSILDNMQFQLASDAVGSLY